MSGVHGGLDAVDGRGRCASVSWPAVIWVVAIPLLASALAPAVCRVAGQWSGWVLAAAPIASVVLLARHLPLGEEPLVTGWSWVPGLGVRLSLLLDGLSATFGLLIAGIGVLVVIYAGGYMAKEARLGSFYCRLLLFMGAMLGVVLSDDIISLFVFWELTSLSSFLLIGFWHEQWSSRQGALQALLVTALGGLALLAGLLLLQIIGVGAGLSVTEAGQLSRLQGVDVLSHWLCPAAIVLILAGAFAKSAQWPMHFWLVSAMAAPTPVSAYLHSATMVKAGVYLVARLNPAMADSALWQTLVIVAGTLTMLTGAVMALSQHDLKRILAYTTISVLGMLMLLIGVGTAAAIAAMVVLLVAHALYKAALFMVAGIIDHEAGTRDVREVAGLRRLMPVTATVALLAAWSMAGAPPMLGFVSKELFYKAKLDFPGVLGLLLVAAVLSNVLMVTMALVAGVQPFWGRARHRSAEVHEAPASMLLGPAVLALASLGLGLWGSGFGQLLGAPMAAAIAGEAVKVDLSLWHGLKPEALLVLGLSVLTLGVGVAVYAVRARALGVVDPLTARASRWGPAAAYEWLYAGLFRLAETHTRLVQHGYLRWYLLTVLLVLVSLAMPSVMRAWHLPAMEVPGAHEVAVVAMILVGAVGTVFSREWMSGVLFLGVTGMGVTLLFALFSAPDLAITQIMVETLTVILFVLVFYHLPAEAKALRPTSRVLDVVVAVAFGGMAGGLVLAADAVELPRLLSEFYGQASLERAYGRNVVNVILVDFRALDTLGEITVLAVAGIGVVALLRPARRSRDAQKARGREQQA